MNPPTLLSLPTRARYTAFSGPSPAWGAGHGILDRQPPGDEVWFQRVGVVELTAADRVWPGWCRQVCAATLHRCRAAEQTGPGKLLVSELVTNALQHGDACRPIGMGVWCSLSVVRIEVACFGTPWVPPVTDAGLYGESGRGLQLVNACADRWGITPDADRAMVWCELDRHQHGRAA
ncbi:ATP-binding protein [Streptomyces sp. NPDC059070]|uniref:ATP-binding protein n=1 Tax=Streptomyces sp. NPDC059070 TaxID=3346713 RepID=UPI003676417B